jgi:hypothetical protein
MQLLRLLAALSVFAFTCLFAGCTRPALKIESTTSDATLAPRAVTSIYRYGDRNTMDIIVSDLPYDALVRGLDAGRLSGNVTHIHLFFNPEPGRTPLDASASNTTIRHIVFVNDQLGVYGGGGLLRPSSVSGDSRVTASIRGASMRLLDATPGFIDRLGSADLVGSLSATRDDEATTAAVNRLAVLYLRVDEAIESTTGSP